MTDYEHLANWVIPSMLVVQLKQALRELNSKMYARQTITGNKDLLINRLKSFLSSKIGDPAQYHQCKNIIMAAAGGSSTRVPANRANMNHPSAASTDTNRHHPHPHSHQHPHQHHHHQNQSQHQHKHNAMPAAGSNWCHKIKFKSSPFYEVVERITAPKVIPDIGNKGYLQFILNAEQIAKLKERSPAPTHKLLLFSASHANAFNNRSGTEVNIEFPVFGEVRVNGVNIKANLRPLKNGIPARPPDLTKFCRMDSGINTVEVVDAAFQKFVVTVQLVRTISIDSILDKIRTSRIITKEEELKKFHNQADEDILTSSTGLSLKCPLGHTPIKIPLKSSHCRHLQCFDGYNYLSMNEHVPTWKCPVCNSNVYIGDLVYDGYFADIIHNVPDGTEGVIVEADGHWRLEKPDSSYGGNVSAKRKRDDMEIILLDDEEEKEGGRNNRNTSPGAGNTSTTHMNSSNIHSSPSVRKRVKTEQTSPQQLPQPHSRPDENVIDLTLDDDNSSHYLTEEEPEFRYWGADNEDSEENSFTSRPDDLFEEYDADSDYSRRHSIFARVLGGEDRESSEERIEGEDRESSEERIEGEDAGSGWIRDRHSGLTNLEQRTLSELISGSNESPNLPPSLPSAGQSFSAPKSPAMDLSRDSTTFSSNSSTASALPTVSAPISSGPLFSLSSGSSTTLGAMSTNAPLSQLPFAPSSRGSPTLTSSTIPNESSLLSKRAEFSPTTQPTITTTTTTPPPTSNTELLNGYSSLPGAMYHMNGSSSTSASNPQASPNTPPALNMVDALTPDISSLASTNGDASPPVLESRRDEMLAGHLAGATALGAAPGRRERTLGQPPIPDSRFVMENR
ncbi:uncharacterized protein VTP21DRAFT_3820 [Calcarisporiella thermophila]|uniref:uncharacterized protein n=1 Tax=Calcarisporiella thermophila TaxID=911321 RepID=UPI0037439FB5